MCREAGVRVEYCAEEFKNDGSFLSNLMKHLKRGVAGEKSRELSVKVFAAQCRLVKLGFRQGGPPGYGLRRLLLNQVAWRHPMRCFRLTRSGDVPVNVHLNESDLSLESLMIPGVSSGDTGPMASTSPRWRVFRRRNAPIGASRQQQERPGLETRHHDGAGLSGAFARQANQS